MKKGLFIFSILFFTGSILIAQSGIMPKVSKEINGVLRVSEINPRYFTDNSDKAVYLTGSHTWANFQEHYTDMDSVIFDWEGYLDMMQNYGHNFMRFWMYEQPEGQAWTREKAYVSPMYYARTGKEMAHDGKPKFDLDKWNEEYFKRMRARIIEAGNRGIYTSIMLFQGWSQNKLADPKSDPFLSHPYNKLNNINGIDVINTINDQTDKPTLHSMGNKSALARQEAYIRKVIETVNDLDNVLFEVINEGGTTEWCYHIIQYIRQVEKGYPKKHMIGLGARINPPMLNKELWDSPADYVSPGWEPAGWSLPGCIFLEDYGYNPPANQHNKVCILDTDHIWGLGGNYIWAWKSFCRGLNPIFMDSWQPLVGSIDPVTVDFIFTGDISRNQRYYPDYEPLRKSLGYIRSYADKMDLTSMVPHDELSTTRYCLANPEKEYLIYFPEGGKATINLTLVKGDLEVEWFIPSQNQILPGPKPVKGGYFANFESPYIGDAVLYLKKK
jgi:hypothetical protein